MACLEKSSLTLKFIIQLRFPSLISFLYSKVETSVNVLNFILKSVNTNRRRAIVMY